MPVKVLFFGRLRDIVGRAEDQFELAGQQPLQGIFDHYARAFPALRSLASSIVMARNQEFAMPSVLVSDGDEVAFLPPVSGGSGEFTQVIEQDDLAGFYALTRAPIGIADLKRRTVQGTDGAVVVFEGVVRDNTKGRPTLYLDYEGYEPLAVKTLAQIGAGLLSGHAIGRIAIVHRLGRMQTGETSVAIVVTAPHRKPAFAASHEAIDKLKMTVPIWKKEYFEDGEVWVDGEWDDSLLQR